MTMFVNEVNDVKIYNLSAGSSVPQWLTNRRKRSHLKPRDACHQIELVQDFNMPGVCTSIRMSPDQQYILATGTYKPRVKCFEVGNLSLKFERCFDSEITTFEFLSDDYSKIVFLQCDRFIEIHAAWGRHFRLRIPRIGHDIKYYKPSCDLFVVGNTNEIYRLNLERGQFLQPYITHASCINSCDVSVEHNLLLVGSKESTIEAWDPRAKECCGTLDVAMKLQETATFPSVSTVKFKNGLHVGVGTASGHVLLYDIRSREPLLIKDHLNKMPIKRISFNASYQAVYSLDETMLKLWDENTGKPIAYVESHAQLNDFCVIPESGIIFVAQEDMKMLTYYLPAMGPAPRWCSFLENLTEEIESEIVKNMYDDYQFVTSKELEEFGLEHLIGSSLLKGYMHGYFMDARLYRKAQTMKESLVFEDFRKEKIRQEMQSLQKPRLQVDKNLLKYNQQSANELLNMPSGRFVKQLTPTFLQDQRFKAMFENPDFAINTNTDEYKLLSPVLNRLDRLKTMQAKNRTKVSCVHELHEEDTLPEDSHCDNDLFGIRENENGHDSLEEDSTDDEREKFSKEMKNAYRNVVKRKKTERLEGKELMQVSKKYSRKNDHVSEETIALSHNSGLEASSPERVCTNFANGDTKICTSVKNRQIPFDRIKQKSYETKKREINLRLHRKERMNLNK